jgi:hypothetical protein
VIREAAAGAHHFRTSDWLASATRVDGGRHPEIKMIGLGVVGNAGKLDSEDSYGWWEQFFIQQKGWIKGGEIL